MNIYEEMNVKTKEKIQLSFLKLLEEKHFMKVSVQDIAAGAGVNRGTFYVHYEDKYHLLDEIESGLLSAFDRHLRRLKPDALLRAAEHGEVSEYAIEVFRYIRDHAVRFRVLLGENNHFGFHKRLKQFIIDHYAEKMVENDSFFKVSNVPADYLASFATSAFMGLIEQWLEKNLSESPEEMASMYLKIIFFIREM